VAENAILSSIALLARQRRIDLRPGWSDAAATLHDEGEDGLPAVCAAIGWPPASAYADDPRAHEFPLLVFHPEHGWAVAERLESDNRIRVARNGQSAVWKDADMGRLYDLTIPLPAGRQHFTKAFDVFKAAVFRRKHAIMVTILATVVINLIALVTSLYSMQVYDRVVPRGAFSTLFVLSIGAIAALLFDFILRVTRANLLESESVRIDSEVSEFFFSRAADIRLDARPGGIGTMAAQLRGLEQVRQMLSSSTIFLFADLPFALVFILVIAQLGGVIALVMAISFPISIVLALIFARMIRNDTTQAQISGNKKNGLLVESLDAAETVKANRGQWYMLARWNSLLDELHNSELPVKQRQASAATIFGTIQQISYIAMIAWGAVEVFENRITMGALIACSILAGRVNGPLIGQLPGMLVQWSYSRSSLNMLDALLQLPTERPVHADLLRPNRLAASLAFKDVVFAYPLTRPALIAPKLRVKAGERIGVIGGIGSGKSTLLRLMAGLYAPSQGQVLIDGLDMGQVAEDVVRQHVAYLPQDYRLVNGTLRDNLLLGVSDPGDEYLMETATKSGLAAMINADPRGLDLPISEGGRGLSGGQRVLTGLTRLMLASPNLWLLDEPTANLDVDTEALVLKGLYDRLAPDATLVLVTHKLQLLGMVQRVLVLANGQIVLDGPTAEVMARFQAKTTPKSGPVGVIS